jgi:hypothetical protein
MKKNEKKLADVSSATQSNVNFLSNVLEHKDFKNFLALKDELKDTWHKKQIFRTETEMRMSVLQDAKHPTRASKYWQCVREQNAFFESLMSLSFNYRKKELIQILLEEKLYKKASMELTAKDRMREIDQWSKLKKELDDGSFDKVNVNTHQAESYKKILQNKVKTITSGTSQPEVLNVLGPLQTLERLEKEGIFLKSNDKKKEIIDNSNTKEDDSFDIKINT